MFVVVCLSVCLSVCLCDTCVCARKDVNVSDLLCRRNTADVGCSHKLVFLRALQKLAKKRAAAYEELGQRMERLKQIEAVVGELQTKRNLQGKGRRTVVRPFVMIIG